MERPLPCHPTIDYEDPEWLHKWNRQETGRICAGSLVMAANMSVLPRDQPRSPSRGRPPNAPLAWLLDRGTKLGVADVEIARALAREGIEPLGGRLDDLDEADEVNEADEGDEEAEADPQVLADAQADLVERWAAIIKSSRARARKRQHQT